MQIDFSTTLISFDGKEIKRPKDDSVQPTPGQKVDQVPVTLGWACVQALVAPSQDDANLSGIEKLERFTLAQKLHKEGIIDVNLDQVKMLRDLVAKTWSVAITGAAWMVLDPPASSSKE